MLIIFIKSPTTTLLATTNNSQSLKAAILQNAYSSDETDALHRYCFKKPAWPTSLLNTNNSTTEVKQNNSKQLVMNTTNTALNYPLQQLLRLHQQINKFYLITILLIIQQYNRYNNI